MIESLLCDPSLTEIIFQSSKNIWLEKDGRLTPSEVQFSSELEYHNFLQNLILEARLRPDLETPFADGTWRDFRVHLIQAPLSPQGPVLTLRKRAPCSWTLEHLKNSGWAPESAIQILEKMIRDKKSLLIVGATGTGKTSVLNACLKTLPAHERVLVIEDTDEIYLPNNISVKLLTRTTEGTDLPSYTQTDLVKQSLRMRPDRIIMGEVRGGEAKDLLLAFSTGHTGGLATLHAETERQALMRLEMLVQMGAPQWSLHTIRTLIQTSFSAVIVVERKNEKRKLASIAKIVALEETGFCLEKIF
ncbi:MAG: ATPase, T2SS/T4P/T4SS family [Bdellovibrionota bacterium]